MENLTYKKILKFWLPLLAMWQMMSIEGPYLTALIARMFEPEFNLAAYGVAYSIALIVESPVIMMLSASVALVEDKNSFLKLRNFIYSVNLALVLLMTVILIPPIYNYIFLDIVNLPPRVAHLSHMAVVLLIPWAPAIGYRRFYQGVLIKNNLTKLVAYGTVIRLVAMSMTGIILFGFTNVHGVIVGAASLSAGVITEAVATRFMVARVLKKILSTDEKGKEISYGYIIKFYYPLVLTSFISLGIHPVVIFFLGQSVKALESLAVLPVLNALVFIFRSFGLSFQEVSIALMKTEKEYIKLRNFAAGIAVFVVAALGLVSLTPLSQVWLVQISGLSKELAEFSITALVIYTIFPAMSVWINFQRSLLVYFRNTKPITLATIIEVSGIIIVLLITIKYFLLVGIISAVIAYTVGRLGANLYLTNPFNSIKKMITTPAE